MNTEDQGVIDAIAAILPIPTKPFPLGWEDDTEWEVRRLHASSWVNVELTDPKEVRRWIDAGVQSARVAREAVRMGYRPKDPWVEKSPSSYTSPDGQPIEAPGLTTTWRNRRRARARWRAAEAKRRATAASARKKSEQMAAVMRQTSFDEGFGLATLDILYGTGATIQDGDVIRGFNELVTEVAAMRAQADRDGYLDEDNAGNVSHFLLMAGVVEGSLHVCTPEEQATMTVQLSNVTSWLQSVKA